MQSVNSCPICKGERFSPFLSCNDYTTSQKTFHLIQCVSCQFVITSPQPDKGEIGKYYQSDKYISHTGGEKNLIDTIYLLARQKALRSKRKLITENSIGKTVLDFGCGTGEFLKSLNDHGFETFGVEPSAIAREKAIELQSGKISSTFSSINEQTFDIITLWHVLEHLHDLNEMMENFHKALNKIGTIFIAVPNLNSIDAKHYKSHWAGYDVPRHLWHFSQSNMKTLFNNHGFTLMKTIPMKLDSYYVSMLSESYQNSNGFKPLQLLKAVVTGLKSNLAARANSDYSSLIYIGKK